MALEDARGAIDGVVGTGQDAVGKARDSIADAYANILQPDTGEHSAYESFAGGLHTFAITDNSLVIGMEEYPFAELEPIVITISPTKLRSGAAHTRANGKLLVLQFAYGQAERFAACVAYANDKIAEERGITKRHRDVLQSPNGDRIEVYDGYLVVYKIAEGLLGDVVQRGQIGEPWEFSEVTASITFDMFTGDPIFHIVKRTDDNTAVVDVEEIREYIDSIDHKNEDFDMKFLRQDVDKARSIIAHIGEWLQEGNTYTAELEDWVPRESRPQTFPLCGEVFEFDTGIDVFNNLRKVYYGYAGVAAEALQREYDKKVHDLSTWMKLLPRMYLDNLKVLVMRAIDILVASGVYTVTSDMFARDHFSEHHLVPSILGKTAKKVVDLSQTNVEKAQGIADAIGDFAGQALLKNKVLKQIFDSKMSKTTVSKVVDRVSRLSLDQANSIYEDIDRQTLFAAVFEDYWSVYLTLANYLKENGKDIWLASEEPAQQAHNIFENLSNPFFPKDQLTKTFVDVMKTDPYREEYHQFMVETFGESFETDSIREYFGFKGVLDQELDDVETGVEGPDEAEPDGPELEGDEVGDRELEEQEPDEQDADET